MIYGLRISFRPFGGHQKAWFVKHYHFLTRTARDNFVKSLPSYKRKYPFEIGFYVEEEN